MSEEDCKSTFDFGEPNRALKFAMNSANKIVTGGNDHRVWILNFTSENNISLERILDFGKGNWVWVIKSNPLAEKDLFIFAGYNSSAV